MAVKTAQLYLDSLKDRRPVVHILREKVENIYEHSLIGRMLNLVAET